MVKKSDTNKKSVSFSARDGAILYFMLCSISLILTYPISWKVQLFVTGFYVAILSILVIVNLLRYGTAANPIKRTFVQVDKLAYCFGFFIRY